ncbi:DNA-binding transcriptional MerR regulator [Pseudonocardia sediminis]|uniref:DNA-binding transcriptional MerR regulator n=1 Tax=Pseudonocardia sediminis TaxID=1397368 RepID=A0A4Q7UWE3_PSEST|nr:MerR family transcriptional regulator [Pseudonocardia sediminis]RZT86085.1 DNA-binding transcriptional MerR regulator [Pseudonocardia sediminis]
MLSIGQFAQSTDLTVKALRHYDERGLLVPARVDPQTRHRAYGDAQIRDAVVIKALRDADVPVESVRRALTDPATTREILTDFRTEVTAARAAQDAALDAAEYLAAALENPGPVEEREAPLQHFAAVVVHIATDGSQEVGDDSTNTAFGDLHRALTEHGHPPTGPFWTGIDAVPSRPELAELTLCWPTAEPVGDGLTLPDMEVRAGTLPERRELVSRHLYTDGETLPEGVPHPAFIALLSELARRAEEDGPESGDLAAVRQVGILGDEGLIGVELAVTMG